MMTTGNAKDCIVRFLFEDCAVRGVWVNLQKSYEDMLALKDVCPAGRVLLGESVAAALLLSSTIKLQGRLALQARGDGALQLLVAESTQDGGVRGVIKMDAGVGVNNMPSLQQLIGDGYLAVTLLPDEGDSYQGIVPLQGTRLQHCLAEYFEKSEQLKTVLWLASDGVSAAGLLLQAMPDGENDEHGWEHLHILTNTVSEKELLSLSCEDLLHRLFHQEIVRLFDAEPVRFQCTCSVGRSRAALAVLGRDELQKLFLENPQIEVDCEFCGAHYQFSAEDLTDILGDIPASIH
jgi:molecular chaperone Hsp33